MKKILSIILSALICASCITVSAGGLEEELDAYPWARAAVGFCYENGIIEGDEYGDFDLGGNITRAQMARIFTDAFGLDSYGAQPFEDVNDTDWFYGYSLSIQGSMPVRFADFYGGEYVTREEFASTLVKASGGAAADSFSVTRYTFKDSSEVDDAYKNLVETAVLNLYMIGEDKYLRPKDLLTRAEACSLLYRVMFPDEDKTSITGGAQVSLESAQEWARSKGASDLFVDAAPIYWYWGDVFGIRPEVMYAQAGKETGYGKYGGAVLPEMNNWAGIKIKNPEGDRREDHESFATPEDGIRAHFNHMCAYIGIDPIGEVHDRYYVVKSISWAGTIRYVENLGGRWCPDIYYGYDLVRMIDDMMSY